VFRKRMGGNCGAMAMTAVLVALWLAHSAPEVAGDSTCPTAAEVRDRLSTLTDSGGAEAAGAPPLHRVSLSSTNQAIHVEWLAADGSLLAERTLDRTGNCSDLAEAVAVVVSTWEATFNPGLAAPIVHPPVSTYEVPTPGVTEDAEPRANRPATYDIGLGLLASIAGGEAASGASLDGSWRPFGSPMGLRLMLSGTSPRTQTVPQTDIAADWMRVALSAGPNYRLGRNAALLEVHASGVLALLHMRGTGLLKAATDTSAQLAIEAGVRGLWVWSNDAVWLGVKLLAYPGQDRLTIGNYGDAGELPHWEAQIAFGVSLGQFH